MKNASSPEPVARVVLKAITDERGLICKKNKLDNCLQSLLTDPFFFNLILEVW
jgi:hypothetical protein